MGSDSNAMHKRAKWHDYRSRCMYMITLSKRTGVRPFSTVLNLTPSAGEPKGEADKQMVKTGEPKIKGAGGSKMKAGLRLSDTGMAVCNALDLMIEEFPMLKVMKSVVMPDHVHFLLFVMERTDRHLSDFIKVFKWNCTKIIGESIFEDGFNDKIVFKNGQRQNFYDYIEDNPRRLLARRVYPEYFRKVNNLVVEGHILSLYGNLFLLNHPIKTVVRFSRKFDEKKLREKEYEYAETIRSGGVLISPFIHPEEKRVRQMAIESGGRIIQIAMNGFAEKYKPSGKDFALCEEGRLLIIAPPEHKTQKIELRRGMAMGGNELAEMLAELNGQII